MNNVRASAPQLQGLVPYDPKYLPARAMLSANENPRDVDEEVRKKILRAVKKVPFNRYPDPLANDLRDVIAEANGLTRECVLVGNGGDELLFNLALAWGGPGRTFLNMPPTFSVYAAIKKKGGFDALRGMTFESLITGVLGLAFFALASAFPAIWNATPPSYDALAVSDGTLACILLVIAGALTVAPLLLYSAAANDVPFVILGFMQYLSPTISMLVAVFLFGEAFTLAHAICFGLVWIGLAGVGIESVRNFKTAARKTNG